MNTPSGRQPGCGGRIPGARFWRSSQQVALIAGGLVALALVAVQCAPRQIDGTSGIQGVVIIDIDTLRADHLGAYGYERATSPTMDRMASEGVLFEWAFGHGPNTPPSQGSILTGLYPSTHGFVKDGDRLPQDVDTLAEILQRSGYRTAAFVDGGYMSAVYGVNQGFEIFEEASLGGVEKLGDKVFDWLSRVDDERFLLLFHTYDVHTPYQPPEPWSSMFTSEVAEPSPGFEPDVETLEAVRTSVWTDDPIRLPDRDLEFSKARYDGGIRYVDDWLAALRRHLEELELLDEVLLVVVSDHGEEFGEHGSVLHEKLYSTVTRVPLILRFPGGEVRRRVPDAVGTIDLLPTLLEALGEPVPENLEGRSLMPLIEGAKRERTTVFGESPYFAERRFVADAEYRLLSARLNDRVELFRYREDPLELTDLSQNHPDVVERLRMLSERWEERERPEVEAEDVDAPPHTEEQLRRLGYIQ